MKKPTFRKSDRNIVTIRIEHNLTFDDLLRCCVDYLNIQDPDELDGAFSTFSKRGFKRHIKESISDRGFFSAVNPDLECFDEVEEEVKAFLLKRYPELD